MGSKKEAVQLYDPVKQCCFFSIKLTKANRQPPIPRASKKEIITEVPRCLYTVTLRHSLSLVAITFGRMRKKDSFLSLQFYETGSVMADKIIVPRPDGILHNAVGFISTANIRQRIR